MYHTLKKYSFLAVAAITLLIQSCTDHPKEAPKEEKFVVTDSLLNKLVIDTVQGANNRFDLSFSAKITANEQKMAKVFPMVSGLVQTVPVHLGDHVTKGQVLATMSSAEMAGFDKEAISSSADLKSAQRSLKLAEDMYKSGLSSARELEQAQNDLTVKQAEYKRSNSILSLNGGNKNGSYALRAPLEGFVIEKNVNNSMQVRPDNSQNLFTVADLSDVWAMINIYESDISKVKEGDDVDISILSYPDKKFKGKISKIYNVLDNDSKVMNARVVIHNPGLELKPGMMATVQIAAQSGSTLPVVNADCLIFDNDKYYVVVLDPIKKVRIQEVEIGRKFEDKAYISKGLQAGDRVVGSKQLFLYESLKP